VAVQIVAIDVDALTNVARFVHVRPRPDVSLIVAVSVLSVPAVENATSTDPAGGVKLAVVAVPEPPLVTSAGELASTTGVEPPDGLTS
jgi:hypothetical protein